MKMLVSLDVAVKFKSKKWKDMRMVKMKTCRASIPWYGIVI